MQGYEPPARQQSSPLSQSYAVALHLQLELSQPASILYLSYLTQASIRLSHIFSCRTTASMRDTYS